MMQLVIKELKNKSDFLELRNNILSLETNDPFDKIIVQNSNNEKDRPYYFLFLNDGIPYVIMPFFLRNININGESTEYYDVSSPYGYSGPIYRQSIDKDTISEFWMEVDNWYKNNNIITEFIRFNLNNNHLRYNGDLEHTLMNVKGAIIDEDNQWKNFKPKVRNNYRRAIKENLSIKIFENEIIDDTVIELFHSIYIGTMNRNRADDQYFYSLDYFKELIKLNSENFIIAMVYKDNQAISTELILTSEKVIYSFLGGTLSDFFYARPNDFLKIEIMKWARKRNISFYVLGGGRLDGDGLYKYKKAFFPNDDDVVYYTGRKVIDPNVYKELIMEINTVSADVIPENIVKSNYFPKYREEQTFIKSGMIKIVRNKEEWQSILNDIGNYDFYHTYDYHQISKNNDEDPVLITYIENDVLIALPLIIRNIPGTSYNDATSVYGYAGPISKNTDGVFDNTKFVNELKSFFNEQNIITVFSRLNPFIKNQLSIIEGLGEKPSTGDIVSLDLTEDLDIQRAKYSRRTKTHVNKSRRFCTVRQAANRNEIDQYIDIYYENMDRVNATKSYYFSKDYFYKLIDSNDFESEILVIEHNESKQIIAGAMFIKTNDIVQYHLSGAKNDFLELTPAKLLIDEMRVKATEEGYKVLNLGGGLGGQNDSLFSFKSSFSKNFTDFKVWKYILNEQIYKELTKEKEVSEEQKNFFPLYRI